MTKAPRSPRWVRLALALPVLLLAVLRILDADPITHFEDRVYDAIIVPLLPAPDMSDRIVIIEVDDRTLTDLGERWPLGHQHRCAARE